MCVCMLGWISVANAGWVCPDCCRHWRCRVTRAGPILRVVASTATCSQEAFGLNFPVTRNRTVSWVILLMFSVRVVEVVHVVMTRNSLPPQSYLWRETPPHAQLRQKNLEHPLHRVTLNSLVVSPCPATTHQSLLVRVVPEFRQAGVSFNHGMLSSWSLSTRNGKHNLHNLHNLHFISQEVSLCNTRQSGFVVSQ